MVESEIFSNVKQSAKSKPALLMTCHSLSWQSRRGQWTVVPCSRMRDDDSFLANPTSIIFVGFFVTLVLWEHGSECIFFGTPSWQFSLKTCSDLPTHENSVLKSCATWLTVFWQDATHIVSRNSKFPMWLCNCFAWLNHCFVSFYHSKDVSFTMFIVGSVGSTAALNYIHDLLHVLPFASEGEMRVNQNKMVMSSFPAWIYHHPAVVLGWNSPPLPVHPIRPKLNFYSVLIGLRSRDCAYCNGSISQLQQKIPKFFATRTCWRLREPSNIDVTKDSIDLLEVAITHHPSSSIVLTGR